MKGATNNTNDSVIVTNHSNVGATNNTNDSVIVINHTDVGANKNTHGSVVVTNHKDVGEGILSSFSQEISIFVFNQINQNIVISDY